MASGRLASVGGRRSWGAVGAIILVGVLAVGCASDGPTIGAVDSSQSNPGTPVTDVAVSPTIESTSPPSVAPPPTIATEVPAAASWKKLPSFPLDERVASVLVAAGDELFVWGGAVPEHMDGSLPYLANGALLDADRTTWRTVSQAPLPGGMPTAVWTGESVVVLVAGAAAQYWPAEDRWVAMDGRSPQEQPLVVANGLVHFVRDGFAWDIAAQTWAPDQPPLPHFDYGISVLEWNGDLIAITINQGGGQTIRRLPAAGDAWVEVAVTKEEGWGAALGIWGDELVNIPSGTMQPAALNLRTGASRELPTAPGFGSCPGSMITVGEYLVADLCSTTAALARTDDQWRLIGPVRTWRGPLDNEITASPGGLVLHGWEAEVDPAGGWLTPVGEQRIHGLMISSELWPEVTAVERAGEPWEGPTSIDYALTTGCALTIRPPEQDGRRTMATARAAALQSPSGRVQWWSDRGDYALDCPDVAAYTATFDGLQTTGELSSWSDATEEVRAALGVVPSDWFVNDQPLRAAFDLEWSGIDPNDPAVMRFGVAVEGDDSVSGLEYLVRLAPGSTADTWTVAEADVASVCARGVDVSGRCV